MHFTLRYGKHYGAEIVLTGMYTMASDEDIVMKLEEFGFRDVKVQTLSDEVRIATGRWSKKDYTGEIPEMISYVEEQD